MSLLGDFRGAAFEEGAHAVLGLRRALGDARHQRFGQETLVGGLLGDAREEGGSGVNQYGFSMTSGRPPLTPMDFYRTWRY